MRQLAGLVLIATLAAPLPALAYTQQDVSACTPDAMRLCQDAIPDETRVGQCLFKNKRQLSAACNAVFSRPRAASTTPARPSGLHKANY